MTDAAIRLHPLTRPESFQAGLRAPGVQVGALRLQYRGVLACDRAPATPACMVGFVLPKRWCRYAVRRNLLRRVWREALREALRDAATAAALADTTLIVRLTTKLPAEFVSAASPALRRYVRDAACQLIAQLLQRRARQPG